MELEEKLEEYVEDAVDAGDAVDGAYSGSGTRASYSRMTSTAAGRASARTYDRVSSVIVTPSNGTY